jgi:uncharacterized protein (TIGR00255 family)
MLMSMTGYGKAEKTYTNKTLSVEIKSLNSKHCDINVKLPYLLREKELEIRKQITQKLQRGKISCLMDLQYTDEEKASTINQAVVRNYMRQIRELTDELEVEWSAELLRTALQMPDSLQKEDEEVDEDEWKFITQTLDKAMDELQKFREQEGEAMENDFQQRIKIMSDYLKEVEMSDSDRIDRIRDRIKDRFNEIKSDYELDEQRFEQELVYYLEKLDITEEKVRLQNHFDYFLEIMENQNIAGKKLNFVAQEIGREINTIGSKANDASIQKVVVQMKDELEKIKEQLMNVL